MPEQPEIYLSDDGSHTLISDTFHSSYHSKHGAITESNTVFIDAGLNYLKDKNYSKIDLFEMGFGTGLNAILGYEWACKQHIPINYHTVEAYPISVELAHKLNFGKILQNESTFNALHQLSWNNPHIISKNFTFQKYLSKIESLQIIERFDIIFYDAFGPGHQAELWEIEILKKMYDLLKDRGVLVSFCAQGAFKRNLKTIGFTVEALPGPPGKREMTRAIKDF